MDGTHIKAIDSVGDPPLPIPNREVKPDSADGTANVCGRVGHRHFFQERALANAKARFFLYICQLLIPIVEAVPMVLKCLWESSSLRHSFGELKFPSSQTLLARNGAA